jgi:hypothetical protein
LEWEEKTMPRVTGFVRVILGRDQTHAAEPFVVEIYSPTAQLGQRTQRYQLEEVCDSREFVLVSVLRDALAHGLPVDIGVDDQRRIHDAEIRTRNSYLQADPDHTGFLKGRVEMLSVATQGMSDGSQWQGAVARVRVQQDQGPTLDLHLDLQSPDRDIKLIQLEMVQHAYRENLEVGVNYETIGVLGGGARHWVREVTIPPPLHFVGEPL